jgi:hypothetical protein
MTLNDRLGLPIVFLVVLWLFLPTAEGDSRPLLQCY